MKNLFDLTGKTAVVTGGAGLLGRAYAQGVALFGADVFIADINSGVGNKVAEELRSQDLKVGFVPLDISDVASIEACAFEILKKKSRIDIWVNNAYPRTKDWHLPFEKIPPESWRKNVDGHLNGYCFCCQKVLEVMKRQKKGSLINIASTYGINGPDFSIYEGTEMTMPAAYAVIKGGLVNFTKYLASYYAKHGVRVNALSPGGVFDNQPESFVKNYNKKTPLGRMARPEDMVGAIVYLASDASSYVTGHNLVVDGGWSAV